MKTEQWLLLNSCGNLILITRIKNIHLYLDKIEDNMQVKINAQWKESLQGEFDKPYFEKLVADLKVIKDNGSIVYPKGSQIFNAFELTPPDKVKAIIIGQDPYHNPDEAMGLCFSVPKGIRVPPSLKNIYKELKTDLDIDSPDHGDLTSWAHEGVLMLNSVLTVEKNKPASHQSLGWQTFTDQVIKIISEQKDCVVFILWGNYARTKTPLIDLDKHLVIAAPHPSPLARGAFFGHRPFSNTNKYLEDHGIGPIDWQLK